VPASSACPKSGQASKDKILTADETARVNKGELLDELHSEATLKASDEIKVEPPPPAVAAPVDGVGGGAGEGPSTSAAGGGGRWVHVTN
jgi:hypothetical protein